MKSVIIIVYTSAINTLEVKVMIFISDNNQACDVTDQNAVYPYDCTKFYDCSGGSINPPLESCPDGFVYSYQYQSCQHPGLVPCAGEGGDGE